VPTKRDSLASQEYEERLRFERLLADLSARFINLPADEVDAEINSAQRQVCECLQVDVSALWQLPPEGSNTLILTHLYSPPDFPPVPETMDAQEHFPWSVGRILEHDSVIWSRLSDAPAEALSDLGTYQHFGLKSVLTLPLSAGGGRVFGALNFSITQKEKEWPPELVNRLELVAQVFANALARKLADQTLRESEERLQLATDASGVGLWGLEIESGRVWASDRLREIFQFAPSEELAMDSFLRRMHPDDRDRVEAAVRSSIAHGTQLEVEYRIELPGGETRWIIARGRVPKTYHGKLEYLLGSSLDSTERKRLELETRRSLDEVRQLRDQLQLENLQLRERIQRDDEHYAIVGESEAILQMLARAKQVAPTDSTVLITGETGTGKELLAQAIHNMSRRRARPMVKVNCVALPASLIESELFGREKGAYTGALTQHIGRFELADRSTIFLDEIGDLPLELQIKLLRVLEEGEFERLGSNRTRTADVRVIAATNRDMSALLREGKFREDLYHRLYVFPIEVPPLRSRADDIPLLVWRFVQEFNGKMGKPIDSIPKRVMEQLKKYSWPGNIRELRNLIERAAIVSNSRRLNVEIPTDTPGLIPAPVNLEEVERRHLLGVLKSVHWRIAGRGGAAELLGLRPTTLHSRMKKLGISRPKS
jgi:formate hydrogenlyase transcriptional activator